MLVNLLIINTLSKMSILKKKSNLKKIIKGNKIYIYI